MRNEKKIVCLVVLVFLSADMRAIKGEDSEDTIKVLVYELPRILWPPHNFLSTGEEGLSNAVRELQKISSLDIEKPSEGVSYSVLRNYDVVIVASNFKVLSEEPYRAHYGSDDVEAVKKFVEDGGGLLVLADRFELDNTIPDAFDVIFSEKSILDMHGEIFDDGRNRFYNFYVTEIMEHPITRNIEQIALSYGLPIVDFRQGKVLARTSRSSQTKDYMRGPFDVLLSMEDIGKGRAVFSNLDSFRNWVTDQPDQQNLELLTNIVAWLGEPREPYRKCMSLNEQAQQKLAKAKSLLGAYSFSQAKGLFEDVVELFAESYEIYPDSEALTGIEEVNAYVEICSIGIKADQTFDNAEYLFDNRKYEEAIEEFEKAKSLYEKIEYTQKVELCFTRIEEGNTWIALKKDAIQLFNEAQEVFCRAPSVLTTTGYEEAKSMFERARSKWEAYEDPSQVAACEEKIKLCNEKISRIKRNRIIIVITLTSIGITLITVSILILKARRR
jgi:hypothetical protein